MDNEENNWATDSWVNWKIYKYVATDPKSLIAYAFYMG